MKLSNTTCLPFTDLRVSQIQVQMYLSLFDDLLQWCPMSKAMASETIRKSRGRVRSEVHGRGAGGEGRRRVANECVFSANENGKERKERKRGEEEKEVMA